MCRRPKSAQSGVLCYRDVSYSEDDNTCCGGGIAFIGCNSDDEAPVGSIQEVLDNNVDEVLAGNEAIGCTGIESVASTE